jgi:hypothetical protein
MFASLKWIMYGFSMKRRHLYFLYAAIWGLTIWVFFYQKPHGLGAMATLAIYGIPAFVLYLFSLFLVDVRASVLDASMVKHFLERRKVAVGFFFFALVILILLMSLSS